jgi:hypothetical protein
MDAPVAPPLKVRSLIKPPDPKYKCEHCFLIDITGYEIGYVPLSMNRPTCTTPEAVGILNTIFCRLVACDVGQCMPVAAVVAPMLVVSMTKFLIWR